tara:strand:+ start:83 stop:1411 length:1329 start_codon:yes stop_codon:yes gene_type:complete
MTEKIFINPITETLKKSITESKNRLNFAVPFISGFAKKIISDKTHNNTTNKRLITRFDESNINTFNLPTLEYLIDKGFEICYNNRIHLKLYITDNDAFVTSSNLTTGGFEKNVELTVKVDNENFENCQGIFNDLWTESKHNVITKELIAENIDKYEVLKKRQKFEKTEVTKIQENFKVGSLNIQQLLDLIFNSKEDYTNRLNLAYSANKSRNQLKDKLKNNDFDLSLFYVPEGHPKRRENLFYNFVYGSESKLAGTGLREAQFKDVFEHPEFKNIISFILPESVGLQPWNFEDNKAFFNFCNGLFDFDIPQYSIALPIRLASFFYPEHFVSIFKLNHLQKVCETLGLETDAKSNGERLFAYNIFLTKKMKDIPYDNYIKSGMIYQILYSVELYKRLDNGEDFQDIKKSYKKQWIKYYIEKGKTNLENIKALESPVANNVYKK